MILYVLLCGKLPFDDDFVPSLFRKIKAGVYTVPEHLSRDAAGLIAGMLHINPLKRTTTDDIRKHPWFVVDMPPDLFLDDAEILKNNDFDPDVITEICAVRAGERKRSPTAKSQAIAHTRPLVFAR